jgi:hypothetical protein
MTFQFDLTLSSAYSLMAPLSWPEITYNFTQFAMQNFQRHTSLLEQWFTKWRVPIDLDNSDTFPELKLFNHSVPWSRKVKYHGTIFLSPSPL